MPAPRTLLTGLVIGESPRWHQGRLWFAHWGAQEIIAVDVEGNSEVVAQGPPGLGWSIDWLPAPADQRTSHQPGAGRPGGRPGRRVAVAGRPVSSRRQAGR
jgi:hypothetical protein